jgi:hypothetical protein
VRIDSDIVEVGTAGTRVQILNTSDKIAWIKFTAPTANSGLTYVGLSDVSATNGYVLGAAGGVDATVEMDFRPGSIVASTLYIDAATNGDDVAWIAILV